MPEQDIENINSLNDAEVNDNDETVDDDKPSLEDFYKLEEEKKKLEETNKKLYARLKSSPNKPLGQAVSQSPDITDKLEKLELRTKGYSDDEINFLKPYGGEKALENPYVKQALEIMREKAQAEKAVVDVDGGKSDIEKKYTDDQLKNMPIDELEKLLPKA